MKAWTECNANSANAPLYAFHMEDSTIVSVYDCRRVLIEKFPVVLRFFSFLSLARLICRPLFRSLFLFIIVSIYLFFAYIDEFV